jgi:hypothetical protein
MIIGEQAINTYLVFSWLAFRANAPTTTQSVPVANFLFTKSLLSILIPRLLKLVNKFKVFTVNSYPQVGLGVIF